MAKKYSELSVSCRGEGNRWIADEAIAEKLGLSLQEVRGWLEILHEEGRICLEETLEQHEVYLSDKHKVMIEQENAHMAGEKTSDSDPKKVFVVHGRNEQARKEVFSFLRSLGLEPLEWGRIVQLTGEGTPYVGTVVAKGFSVAQAAIVLMTPDDVGCLRRPWQAKNDPEYETRLTPQARQNVLLEAGMALGWDTKRTVILQFGQVRPLSDLLGRHVIHVRDDSETRETIASRLTTAGCAVERGSDWLREGDFESVLRTIDEARASSAGSVSTNGPEADEHDRIIAQHLVQALPPSVVHDFVHQVAFLRTASGTDMLLERLHQNSRSERRFLDSETAQSFDTFRREFEKLLITVVLHFEADGHGNDTRVHKEPHNPRHMAEYTKERAYFHERAMRARDLYDGLIMRFKRRWPKAMAQLLVTDENLQ